MTDTKNAPVLYEISLVAINSTIVRCIAELGIAERNIGQLFEHIGVVKYARDEKK